MAFDFQAEQVNRNDPESNCVPVAEAAPRVPRITASALVFAEPPLGVTVWIAVHVFALATFRLIVPVVVIVPPERPDPAMMLVTVPLPPPPPAAQLATVPFVVRKLPDCPVWLGRRALIAFAAVVWPVPPLAIAIVVPFQVPVVIVPTVAISVPTRFEAAIDPASIALVTTPAAIVVAKEPVPEPVTFPVRVIV